MNIRHLPSPAEAASNGAAASATLRGAIRRALTARIGASVLGLALLGGTALAVQGGNEAHAAAAPATAAPVSGFPSSFADLVERTRPAVVAIATRGSRGGDNPAMGQLPRNFPFGERFRRYFEQHQGMNREVRGMGSGFVIDADGLIVTNHHVISGADEIIVTLHDGTELEAEVRGVDDKTDLALLEVDADKRLSAVRFGDSDSTRVGDWVVAVGNPFGLGGSYTAGIVSARGRDIRSGPYDDYLQIDAPINQGNSGGALFNVRGEVVGVNTAIFSPNGGNVGIGFAVPSKLAADIIEDLREDGAVARGWLGVQIQGIDGAMADALGMDKPEGALVAAVEPGSPAALAGMRPGDVVLSVGEARVEKMRDLPRLVADAAIGKRTDMAIWRDGKERTLEVKIGALPGEDRPLAASSGRKESAPLGLALAPLDDNARRGLGLDADAEGVVIARVQPGSPAARLRLQPGMRIEQVGNRRVERPSDVADAIAQARRDGNEAVLLLVVDPRDNRQFVALPIA